MKQRLCCSFTHWRRLVKNIGWANQNIGREKVVKIDKCMGVSQLLGGTCPRCPPKSTPMVTLNNLIVLYNYLLIFLGRGGALVELMHLNQKCMSESHSSHHANDLGQVFHLQLPVALRRGNSHSVNCCGWSASE